MVEQIAARLDILFHALSDPTRRGMLADLALEARSVGELAAPHAMSFAAAKHVKVLGRAGLIDREIRGHTHLCRLSPEVLAEADAFLALYRRFWAGRLAALIADDDTKADKE